MHPAMKTRVVAACLACFVVGAQADPLTDADREALLDSLEKLKQDAESKVDARFRMAMTAYRDALASDDATMDFYLKCIEKVNFEDQQKKNSEFREWKRKEADKLSDPSFRVALRHQLRWLTLYIRSASDKADRMEIASDAQQVVDAVFGDLARLRGQQQVLGQAVTASVFARAYEIGNLERVKWPGSPVQLEEFYGTVVFPLLRHPSRVETLRAAWNKRIQHEAARVEEWNGEEKRNALVQESRNPAMEKFVTESLPELKWQMEMDLFRAGDEAGAAKRMLDHITTHVTHRSARAWGEQLRQLLAPKSAAETKS